jgi:TIR domain
VDSVAFSSGTDTTSHTGFALRLKADLERRGHAVWFDAERLQLVADWEPYIEEGLDLVSAEHGKFLLLLTPYSVRRPGGYCLNELARAYSRGLPGIPLMVSTVEAPLSLAAIQWLDFRDCLPRPTRGRGGSIPGASVHPNLGRVLCSLRAAHRGDGYASAVACAGEDIPSVTSQTLAGKGNRWWPEGSRSGIMCADRQPGRSTESPG